MTSISKIEIAPAHFLHVFFFSITGAKMLKFDVTKKLIAFRRLVELHEDIQYQAIFH